MSSTNAYDAAWEEKYRLLQAFVAEHGRFPKHLESYQGVKLGVWCRNQRVNAVKDSYDPERKQKLEAIGLLGQSLDAIWEKHLHLTCEFMHQYGRPPKQLETFQGVHIGRWLTQQRLKASNPSYPANRLQQLKEHGLLLPQNPSTRKEAWNQNYNLLKQFKEEFGRFPQKTETFQNVNLGTWLLSQKTLAKKENYPLDRYQKLNDIGVFGLSPKEQAEKQWEDKLQLVILFYDQYGRFPKAHESFQEVNIGQWCARQRQLVKNQTIHPDRLLKLQSTGFLDADALQKEQEWEERFQLLQSFVQTYGHLPKKTESYQGTNIGAWLANQRVLIKDDTIPPEHLQKLQSVEGMVITPPSREQVWEENFQVFQSFVQAHGRLPLEGESYLGVKIGHWCAVQRRMLKHPNYPEDYRHRLKALGLGNRKYTYNKEAHP